MSTIPLGPNPASVTCPSCHQQIVTKVSLAATSKTHLFALLCCLFGCCCVPYCIDSCKGKSHTCPNCGTFLGTFQD